LMFTYLQTGQLFFGVPVEEQQEESFLSLAAISCFFDDSDSAEEGTRSRKHKERSHRHREGDGDVLRRRERRESGNGGGADLSPLGDRESNNGKRKRSMETGGLEGKAKRNSASSSSSSIVHEDRLTGKGKEKKKEKKKHKRHKSGKPSKSWKLDNLPEVPGLDYIPSNVYK
jgi:hypothetical protein